TLGRVLARLDLPALRALVATVNRRAWRAKMIHGPVGESYRVVAVDGHELWASRARCCAECLTREVTVGHRGQVVREYYHRVVVAQWVGVTPPAILDVERGRAREGGVGGGRRLAGRMGARG